jgi:hypothetical protein
VPRAGGRDPDCEPARRLPRGEPVLDRPHHSQPQVNAQRTGPVAPPNPLRESESAAPSRTVTTRGGRLPVPSGCAPRIARPIALPRRPRRTGDPGRGAPKHASDAHRTDRLRPASRTARPRRERQRLAAAPIGLRINGGAASTRGS